MASDVAHPDPRDLNCIAFLGETRGPFLGADLPPAERRAQVLSRMPLAAPARSVGSSWTRPSTALCLSRVELPTPSKATTPNRVLHGEQMGGRLPCRPVSQQILLRR